MVQATDAAPSDGGPLTSAQPPLPLFPALPVSQILPQFPPLLPQLDTDTKCQQIHQVDADSTSQNFPDASVLLLSDVSHEAAFQAFADVPGTIPQPDPSSDHFVQIVDNYQHPAMTSPAVGDSGFPATFTAFGSVESLPVTRLGMADYGAVDSGLEKEVRADSVDSLDSKGYASDASSDIYMNSDYTDTVTSVDSGAFLLEVSKFKAENESEASPQDQGVSQTETTWAASDYQNESFYTNEAFTDSAVSLVSKFQPEHSLNNEVIVEVQDEENDNENCKWIASHSPSPTAAADDDDDGGEDDNGTIADKEDEGEASETEQMMVKATDSVESLVARLAEQHPSEVVEIRVQVLDEPVYQPLTEPLWEEEENLMTSTESLHHYKLLKQGRTGTMFNLHERQSFLNLTAASVTSLGHVCQRALQYVRADMEFGSMMSLGNGLTHSALAPSGKGQYPGDSEALNAGLKKKKKAEPAVSSARHTRNVVYVSVMVTMLLISINATRNLQSSLNQEGGVGLTSLAVMFAAFTLGSLVSPVVVQKLGVRGSILFGLVLQFVYVATNLYPVMWLMAPASAGGGASLAIIWNATSTYIVLLARGEAGYREKLYERVSDKYFGIFCLVYQCNLVVGNLIASLILTFGDSAGSGTAILLNSTGILNSSTLNLSHSDLFLNAQGFPAAGNESVQQGVPFPVDSLNIEPEAAYAQDTNTSSGAFDPTTETHYHLCGSAFCHHFDLNQDASAVSERTKYLLFGIFLFLVVVAILIAACLLEPLSTPLAASAAKPWQTVKRQVVSLGKFSLNAKFLLLLPLLFYSNMQFSFVCSEVMMAYVTCPVGVWLVGYTMMCYGVSCGLSSYLTQALVHRIGRTTFIGTACVINLVLLLFMRFWQPHPDSLVPLFVITGLFGFSDGVWNVNANGLMGSVFPEHYEEAFTGLRVAQGLGGAISMAYAPLLCMAVKIYIMLGVTVIVLCGYLGAEVLIRRDRRHNALLFEKEIV